MSQNVTAAPEWLYSVVNVADNSTTVHTGKCLLRFAIVHTALSAHDCPIEDTGTTVAALAASSAVGTVLDCGDMLLNTGLTVNPNDSGTGMITIVYKPIHDTAA